MSDIKDALVMLTELSGKKKTPTAEQGDEAIKSAMQHLRDFTGD